MTLKEKTEKLEKEVKEELEEVKEKLKEEIDEAKSELPHEEELPAPLMTFPCLFPMKIVGVTKPEFEEQIVEIIKKYDPQFTSEEINKKTSAKGNYTSLGVVINAQSQDQLDALYQELVDNPLTKFVI